MALLRWLANRGRKSFIEVLENSINQLRIGLFGRLLEKYVPTLGMAQAKMLSAALANEILAEEPANEAGANYLKMNRALIVSEAAKLANDQEVAEIASLLYAAQILLLAFSTGNPMSVRSNELTERATQLRFDIPNTYDLCGTGDFFDAVRAIAERSKIVAANTIMPAER